MKPIVKTAITWGVTSLVGMLISLLLIRDYIPGNKNFLVQIGMNFGLGLVFLFPAMAIYHVIAMSLADQKISGRKIIHAFTALVLIILSLYTILDQMHVELKGYNLETFLLVVFCYAIPFVLCAFIFDYRPGRDFYADHGSGTGAATDTINDGNRSGAPVNMLLFISALVFINVLMGFFNVYTTIGYLDKIGDFVGSSLKREYTIRMVAFALPHVVALFAFVFLIRPKARLGWVFLAISGFWGLVAALHEICIVYAYMAKNGTAAFISFYSLFFKIILAITLVVLLFQKKLVHYAQVKRPHTITGIIVGLCLGMLALGCIYLLPKLR